MDNDSIPRQVAKWAVISAIDVTTTRFVANTAENYTRFDKDNLLVRLGSGAIGMVVCANVKPVTDKFVDKTADFVSSKRAEFVAKKNAKKKQM